MLKLVLLVGLVEFCSATTILEEVLAWKEISYTWPCESDKNEAIKNGKYISANNAPLTLERWKDKLFITVPRWRRGVASSLNYVSLCSTCEKNASLIPYPDWKAHTERFEENSIINTFMVAVDACDRLWVIDTGIEDTLGELNKITPPSIIIFDLNTDKLIRRYYLKKEDYIDYKSHLCNIVIDVPPGKCDQAYAYVADLGASGLVVYSYFNDDSWRIEHNYFKFDPIQGYLDTGGINYVWSLGFYGTALGPVDQNGDRKMYFHPMASTTEFSVNTSVLKNKYIATDPYSYDKYKIEGNKGQKTQSASSVFDEKSNVLFFSQLVRDGVACWNPTKPLKPENVAMVAQDHKNLVYTNEVKLDSARNLWIMSDKLHAVLYRGLNPDEINFRIFTAPIDVLIKGTTCEVKIP